jgi:hypothetical protein
MTHAKREFVEASDGTRHLSYIMIILSGMCALQLPSGPSQILFIIGYAIILWRHRSVHI